MMQPYEVIYEGTNRQAFLHSRKGGIGASDTAAVLGFSKWKTPHDVWEEKTGRAPQRDQTQAMEWGIALEAPIARRFSYRHGHRKPKPGGGRPIGKVLPTPGVLRSRKYPHLLATPDRMIAEFDTGKTAPLEIKTQNAFGRADWEDAPPLYYQAQSQQQQLVFFGDDEVDPDQHSWIVPLIGGNDMPEPIMLPFDHDFAEFMIREMAEWWERYIVHGEEPPLTIRDDVNRIFPAVRGKEVVATAEILALVAERNELRPELSRLSKRDEEIKAALKLAMLDGTLLVREPGGEPLVTWDLPKTPPKQEEYLDLDALSAAHPGIVAEFTRTRPKPQSRTMLFK